MPQLGAQHLSQAAPCPIVLLRMRRLIASTIAPGSLTDRVAKAPISTWYPTAALADDRPVGVESIVTGTTRPEKRFFEFTAAAHRYICSDSEYGLNFAILLLASEGEGEGAMYGQHSRKRRR
jgi:hypothetical protein